MKLLLIIIPIYIIVFLFYGVKNIKQFLLLTGLISLPLRIDFGFYSVSAQGPGWTNGIYITLSNVSFIVLIYYLFINKQINNISYKNINKCVLLFIIACIISITNSTWVKVSFLQIIMLIKVYFLYYVVMSNCIENENDIKKVISFLTASILIQSAVSVYSYVSGDPVNWLSTGALSREYSIYDIDRAFGTIGKPNGFALYVVPILLIILSLEIGAREKNYLNIISIILGIIGLILSLSRGGWVSFFICILILFYKRLKEGYLSAGTFIKIFSIFLFIIIIFYAKIEHRVEEYDNAAATSRIPLMGIAWNMIKEHPIIGVGVNTFYSVIRNYYFGHDSIYLDQVHNMYLLVFAESGIFGLITFVWLLKTLIKESNVSCVIKNNEYFQRVGFGINLGFIALMIHVLVDTAAGELILASLFVMGSIITAINRITTPPVQTSLFPDTRSGG